MQHFRISLWLAVAAVSMPAQSGTVSAASGSERTTVSSFQSLHLPPQDGRALTQAWLEHKFDGGRSRARRRALRHLQDDERACNAPISDSIISTTQIGAIAGTFMNFTLRDTPSVLPAAQQVLLGSIRYNVQAIKVCGTCADATLVDTGGTNFASFRSYCGDGIYGSDATHSALLLVPVKRDGSDKPLTGRLSAYLNMHALEVTVTGAPTVSWPSNVGQYLQDARTSANGTIEFFTTFFDPLDAILAASSGAVAIMPDYLGYGESLATHNRSNVWPEGYMQAAITTMVAAKTYLETSSQNCTTLSGIVTVSGSSEGGCGAVAAARGLHAAGGGYTVKQVYANAPVLDAQATLAGAIRAISNNEISNTSNSRAFALIVPYLGFVGSWGHPQFANTGTGQIAANATFVDQLIEFYSSPDPISGDEAAAQLPTNFLETLNGALVGMFVSGLQANTSRPCDDASLVTVNVTDQLCAYLEQSSAWPALADMPVPTAICYSQNDTVVAVENFPDSIFTGNVSSVTDIIPGVISAQGDHLEAIVRCKINPIYYFTSASEAEPDSPNYIMAWNDSDFEAQCGINTDDFGNPPSAQNNSSPTQTPQREGSSSSSSAERAKYGVALGSLLILAFIG